MWNAITGLVGEIKRCEEAGATVAAVCLAYVCIDTMAYFHDSPRKAGTKAGGLHFVGGWLSQGR